MGAASQMDDEEEAATTVMDRGGLPPESGMRVSVAHSEPQRDTIVDPPSGWMRLRVAVGEWVTELRERFRRPRLSDRLPPLPPPRSARATRVSMGAIAHDERGEVLFLEIMRASPSYQRAAIVVANYALALRKFGDDEDYVDGLVHLALSRMRADADGFVSFARLRDVLCELSVAGTLIPALLRLEEAGIVTLTMSADAAPARIERIQLRIPL